MKDTLQQGLLGDVSERQEQTEHDCEADEHEQARGSTWPQVNLQAPQFSRQLSLTLFRTGLSVQEIARSRGFKRRAVAIHLSEVIEAGEDGEWERVVPRNQYNRIKAAFEQVGARRIPQIMKLLGGSGSYDAIRVPRAMYRRAKRSQ